jgi:hypothetical protein
MAPRINDRPSGDSAASTTGAIGAQANAEIHVPVASRRRAGHVYRVKLSDSGDECDCPDFFWRHINRGDDRYVCKHIAGARQLLVDGIPARARTYGRAAVRGR